MPQHDPPDSAVLRDDRARAMALIGGSVSHETWSRLDRFVALLLEHQQRMNLIAASTVPQVWTRHVADSLQLLSLAPAARAWVDLGSGGGFPGLVIACAMVGVEGASVHLVESTKKKAAFLAEVVADLALPAIVHPIRVEEFTAANRARFDVVTARALAPLAAVLGYASPLLKRGAVGLFPKGQDVGFELTEASKYWKLEVELVPSKTDPRGRIVVIRGAQKR